ncbi:MAG: chorismate synthase [Cryomorphaceae bacterium]
MAGNTFGELFRLTTYGESHGKAIGGIIDGCPPGIDLDLKRIQLELDRRKPGQSSITTQRKESDEVEFLSGIFENKTLGSPIGFIIRNDDAKSKDYDHLKDVYRPSHADYTYDAKYGIRDHRGGGRSSARETACRVVAGAIARQYLEQKGVIVWAYVSAVGGIVCDKSYAKMDPANVDANMVRCPDADDAKRMIALIEATRKQGDTIGGVVTCIAQHIPVGLGEPVFDKLSADLAKAMMSINAVKAFEIGSGVQAAGMLGSAHNDRFAAKGKTVSNHSGGVQGGISNGEDVEVRVTFKPVATLMRDQPTINTEGDDAIVSGKGRHDPCVVPRAVPIVEAMCLLTIADHYLRQQAIR